MGYRRYRYTKEKEKKSGIINNLTALNIGDLKKIKKSLENYLEKKKAHNKRELSIREESKRITEINKKNQKEYDRRLKEFTEKVINKTQKQLDLLCDRICLEEVGLLSSFLEKTISVRGKRIPYATGYQLVEQYRAVENKLSMHEKKVSDTYSKLKSFIKTTPSIPFFEYRDIINNTIPCLRTLEGSCIKPHLSVIGVNSNINEILNQKSFSLYLMNKVLV